MEGHKTCFFCLTSKPEDFCSEDGICDDERRNKTGKSNNWNSVNILLNYLLNTKDNKQQSLLGNIQEIFGDTTNSTENDFQVCSKCLCNANQISEAHRQLEVLQMKIIHGLKSIRGIVAQYFKDGKDESGEILCQKLEIVLKKRKKVNQQKRRRMIEIISQFQLAVHEKGKLAAEIPFVFLDKYMGTQRTETLLVTTSKEEYQNNSSVVVKTESGDIDFEISTYLDQYDDAFSYDDDNESSLPIVDDLNSDLPSEPKKKTLKRKAAIDKRESFDTNTSAQLKEEIEPDSTRRVGKRIRRSREALNNVTSSIIVEKKTRGKTKVTSTKEKPSVLRKRGKKVSTKREKKVKKAKVKQPKKAYVRNKLHCDLCPYKSKFTYLFDNHLRSHETTSEDGNNATPSFTCEKCSKSFVNKQYYTFHLDGHEKRNRTVCDFCKEKIPYSEIAEHVKSHNVDKIFQCPNCFFCCTTREQYLIHLRFHGTGILDCDLCPKFFRTKGKLLEHLHLEHNTVEKHVCEVEGCNREFYDIAHLRIHRNIHKNPVECPDCGKIFLNASVLRAHQRRHTGEDLRHPCSECSSVFPSRSSLQNHCISSHGAPKYKCEYCDKEYSQISTLRTHLTTHEGTGIPCGICDKVMGSKTLWRRHQIVHTTEQNFICEDCGKGFTGKEGLKRHSLIHGGEKKFKCQFCDKVFLYRKYLTDHERTHTKERPFTCGLCGKGFSQSCSLYMHKKKHHPSNQQDAKVISDTYQNSEKISNSLIKSE